MLRVGEGVGSPQTNRSNQYWIAFLGYCIPKTHRSMHCAFAIFSPQSLCSSNWIKHLLHRWTKQNRIKNSHVFWVKKTLVSTKTILRVQFLICSHEAHTRFWVTCTCRRMHNHRAMWPGPKNLASIKFKRWRHLTLMLGKSKVSIKLLSKSHQSFTAQIKWIV